MSALRRLPNVFAVGLASLSLSAAEVAFAQSRVDTSAPTGNDMAMPDDLGMPLEAPAHFHKVFTFRRAGVMSLDTPVGEIASDPRGKAILEKDLPGLCERPEYVMFKGFSLRQLQPMSQGKLTPADLARVQADLSAQQIAISTPRKTHNPLVAGERVVGRVTHAIYKRVVLVVASL